MGYYLGCWKIHRILNNLSQTKTALILGATFKENCPDLRNSKVFDIYKELSEYNFQIEVHDPVADFNELIELYGNSAKESITKYKKYDVLIIAVSHKEFLKLNPESFINKNSVVFDVKGMFPEKPYLRLWRPSTI